MSDHPHFKAAFASAVYHLAPPLGQPRDHADNFLELVHHHHTGPVRLEGKTVASGEAKRISNATPSPKKAKKMRLRERSESARRPLVANVEGASREASVERAEDRKARGQSLERQDSDASATTIESESSVESNGSSRGRGRHTANPSSETINVLLPPPSVFQTPPPPMRTPRGKEGGLKVDTEMQEVKRDTTFEDMMTKAGWRRSEWLKQGPKK